MLLRTCPRCGDFFAGDAPPFCPADGTPLADVDPRGDGREEAARVVEEKARLLSRRARRLKVRRVVMTVMTMTVTTLIVLVVLANAVIYLNPEPEAPAVASAAKTRPTTARDRASPTTPSTTADPTLLLPLLPAGNPAPNPEGAATPDPSRPSTPTPTPSETSTPEEEETATPTPTAEATPTVETTPTVKETVTPTPVRDWAPLPPPPPPPPPPAPTCTGDDKRALRAGIVARDSAAWEDAIRRDGDEIASQYERERRARVSVGLFGPVVYNVNFTKACVPVSVNAVYIWRVRWDGQPAVDRDERGEPRAATPGGDKKRLRTMTFPCSGGGDEWRCR